MKAGHPSPRDVESLVLKLQRAEEKPRVLVLPDFFLDVVVSYGSELEEFLVDVERVARQGGGSLGFRRLSLMRGGNAANTASALAALGAKVYLVTKTSRLGLHLLEKLLPREVELALARDDGELSKTVSIELRDRGRLCNVMISDPGSLASYGPEELGGGFRELLGKVGYVCVLNWTSNRRGTELAEYVLSEAKKASSARTFMDTGDPSQRASEIGELVGRVFKPSLLDALGVNENEARWYASALGERSRDPLQCARRIHEELGVRVDLHTLTYSATFSSEGEAQAPCFKVEPLRATGAGDAWNAANIYAWAVGLEPYERLLFANAAAALYVSDPLGLHPSTSTVSKFLEESFSKLSLKVY
ncbi:MAG: carbohydrate kinase family protein [Candidatus Nezhaarchaeota archaeon]|nr:carbohydrate kinase family protein [Candidatus Nezhaarchaeota archaeon]